MRGTPRRSAHTRTPPHPRPVRRGKSPRPSKLVGCGEKMRRQSSLSSSAEFWGLVRGRSGEPRSSGGKPTEDDRCLGENSLEISVTVSQFQCPAGQVFWCGAIKHLCDTMLYIYFLTRHRRKPDPKKVRQSRWQERLQTLQLTAMLAIKFSPEPLVKVASFKFKIRARPTTRSHSCPLK